MLVYPDIDRVAFELGPLKVHWYGLMYLFGFISAWWIGAVRARRDYLDFLKLGGSKFPLDELSEAGVDMRSPEPIEQAVAHFDHLVDLLIEMQP